MLLELAVESGAEYIVTHNLDDFDGVEQFGIEGRVFEGALQIALDWTFED